MPANVHMLIEKPLASSVEEANQIVSIAKKHNIVLSVGHIERHNPVIKEAKKRLDEDSWGSILTLSAKRFSSYPARISDVGVIHDLTIHDVDIISYLAEATPKTVFAIGDKSKSKDFLDYVNLVMKFDGKLGLCETNWLTPMKVRELSLTTSKYYVSINYLEQKITVLSSNYGDIDSSNLYKTDLTVNEEIIIPTSTEPLKNEIVDFLNSIVTDSAPLVSGRRGFNCS